MDVSEEHEKVDIASTFVDLGVTKLTTCEDTCIDRDTGWTANQTPVF